MVIGFVITADVLNSITVVAGIDTDSIFVNEMTWPDIAQFDRLLMVVTYKSVHDEDVNVIYEGRVTLIYETAGSEELMVIENFHEVTVDT